MDTHRQLYVNKLDHTSDLTTRGTRTFPALANILVACISDFAPSQQLRFFLVLGFFCVVRYFGSTYCFSFHRRSYPDRINRTSSSKTTYTDAISSPTRLRVLILGERQTAKYAIRTKGKESFTLHLSFPATTFFCLHRSVAPERRIFSIWNRPAAVSVSCAREIYTDGSDLACLHSARDRVYTSTHSFIGSSVA